ncbi:MAG: acyl-CoA dehydrogenase family protein [Myxococcales bacterium]|nr:acyl-CoA dehydrogenase family protein [Myxococcales bacterium]
MIDFQPSEEQELIVETVRQFAENEIRPAAREADETTTPAAAVFAHAHELGLVANGLPEEHGGGGERCAVTGALIAEELAWGDLALALGILSPGLSALPIADFGTDAQKKEWLPRFAGSSFTPGSLAIVEPRFDSDSFRPATTARLEGNEYVLDGAKCQVPWLEGDDDLIVIAADGDSAQGFLVSRSATGLKAEREQNMGVRGLPTAELQLEGVRVPREARLGGDAGCDVRTLIARGRTALAACAVGMARAAFEVSRDYAKQREAFGAPIATKQAIAFKLADMAIEIDGARLLAWEAAWRLDQGADALREATLAYQQARRVALQVSDGAVQVFGGHGYIRDYLPELHLRNAAGFGSFEALALV